MPRTERYRETRPVTKAIAAEIKQLMRNAPERVTQMMVAETIDRDQAYVSERLSAKRAFTTDDLDLIAPLLGMDPLTLWQHLGAIVSEASMPPEMAAVLGSKPDPGRSATLRKRVADSRAMRAASEATPSVEDLRDLATVHSIREEAPTGDRLAAKTGRRKADEPHAD